MQSNIKFEERIGVMTKYQRAKARIARDRTRKAEKRSKKFKHCDNFNSVISTQHYVEVLGKCRKGVSWKGSVQLYTQNAITEISKTLTKLMDNKLPKLTSIKRITLYERGKKRNIVPITIKDRMIQRVLCDYALIPVLKDTLIYDNGASMKDKGVDFTRKRIGKHMRQAIKKYGSDFYALTFDFKSFFNSIPHETCLRVLKENFKDRRIIGIIMAIIKSYQEIEIMAIRDPEERKR